MKRNLDVTTIWSALRSISAEKWPNGPAARTMAKARRSSIRDVDGRGIGGRFSDLRSRGTNARNRGLLIVMRPADAPQVAVTQPKI